MSLNTVLLLPLMILAGCYVLTPVVRWVDPPRLIINAYGCVMIAASLLWLFEVAVYILGSILGVFRW